MTMGEYIKYLREGGNKFQVKYTQEELGQKLDPKVNRAAVNKWENNTVTNIKRCHIEQMSVIFGVSPIDLMCFDHDEEQISREAKLFDEISLLYGKDAARILRYYMLLNKNGKDKTLEQLEDMIALQKYKNDTDVTDV